MNWETFLFSNYLFSQESFIFDSNYFPNTEKGKQQTHEEGGRKLENFIQAKSLQTLVNI